MINNPIMKVAGAAAATLRYYLVCKTVTEITEFVVRFNMHGDTPYDCNTYTYMLGDTPYDYMYIY